MNIKHNKLKNSGILFELLVRQITNDTLNNKESKALNILKKYYNNTEISKEFKLFNTITSSKNLSEGKANILISSILEEYRKLNVDKLKKDKYNLISEIKANYDIDDFFKTKLDNYKLLGSIHMLFEIDGLENKNIKDVTEHKFAILESISKSVKEDDKDDLIKEFSKFDKGTRFIVYKMMIESFNKKYEDLDPKQKKLLKEYINNVSTGENLKKYVNEEFESVKTVLTKKIKTINDDVRKVKLKEVLSFIKPISENKNVNDKDMHNLLYYYDLITELDNINE